MTPLAALAQAVEAGRAGQPPSPEALAVLGAVLQALQDGVAPAQVLAPEQARQRGRPRDLGLRERHFWRVVTVLELMEDGLSYKQARDRVLEKDVRTGDPALDPGLSDSQLRKLFAKWSPLAGDLLIPAPPPMDDRPDASEDFRGT